MNEALKLLQDAGWKCSLCSCPGKKGWDCGNTQQRGVIIQLRATGYKLYKAGHLTDAGHLYQLKAKLESDGIL